MEGDKETGPFGAAEEDNSSWAHLFGYHSTQNTTSQGLLETLLLSGLQGLCLGEPNSDAAAAAPSAAYGIPLAPPALPAGYDHLSLQHAASPSFSPSAALALPQLTAAGAGNALQPGPSYIPTGGQAPLQAGPVQIQGRQQQQPRARRPQQQLDFEKVRRTVYVCDIDQQVSEAELAGFFQECGAIVDCRICGDPNSAMRFAFIEFQAEVSAQQALSKSGCMLGMYQLRVSPSKTAIVPVKTDFLPTSLTEREAVARTIYVANIDRSVERDALHDFFTHLCGPITKLRLLGDAQHTSKIAFVEFESASSACQALNCSGALLGALPLRISPSKTPVRLDAKRATNPTRNSFLT